MRGGEKLVYNHLHSSTHPGTINCQNFHFWNKNISVGKRRMFVENLDKSLRSWPYVGPIFFFQSIESNFLIM